MDVKKKVFYFLGILILAIPTLLIVLQKISNENLSPKDSDAIYGGRIEKEYISAGYLISYTNTQNATICGVTKLSKTIAITAAHCFESTDQVYLSADPSEPQLILNAIPVTVYKSTKWDGKTSNDDFAVLNYTSDNNFEGTYANITAPSTGCNYRVVGYGRTSDDEILGIDRTKRSTKICIKKYDDDLIYIKGDGGGICMGDSGSPIFEEGTENIVGIISSVFLNKDPDTPCFLENEGIAVRVDGKLPFIQQVAENVFNNEDISDTTEQEKIEAIPEELLIKSDGDNLISNLFVNNKEKVFGMDIQVLSKIYLGVVILFLTFAIKIFILDKLHKSF